MIKQGIHYFTVYQLYKEIKKLNKKHKNYEKLRTKSLMFFVSFFYWFARFQILICEPLSIWRKLLGLSWLYLKIECAWLFHLDIFTKFLMRPYCITTASADSETEGSERSNEESSSENNGSKKEKVGFRDRKIIDYENRLRAYSAPDKIFRYFATVATVFSNGQREDIYMTPDDFVRSLTIDGDLQPEDCLIDKYRTVKTSEVCCYLFK